jgi:formylglycine-generating enzyme required for sulfatase activity
MIRSLVGCVVVNATLSLTSIVRAAVLMDWAVVGDIGNAGDVQSQGTFGFVSSQYFISKREVTNAQYVEFLNAKDSTGTNPLGLYDGNMSTYLPSGGIDFTAGAASGQKYAVKPGRGNNHVTFVSFYSSIRFVNWMNNGQGTGDSESGAYTLVGGAPTPANGSSLARNAGATVFLPSEDEWYKAAYYKGGGTNAGYWDYATQSDTLPTSDQPPGTNANNSANYYNDDGNAGNGVNDGWAATGSTSFNSSQDYLTNVGAYADSLSAYGTYDQSGNVFEWNETLIGSSRGFRGGTWWDVTSGYLYLPASNRFAGTPSDEGNGALGFRVASIPEPTGATMCIIAGAAVLRRRARR